jgi:predicted DNA-binding transcriptional regulator YafY
MPTSKNAYKRYLIIDKCLQRRHLVWTIKDLLKAVEDEYRETTTKGKGVCERTLKGDLHDMKLPMHHAAPIEYTRTKGYHYTDPEYSIRKTPLTSADLVILHQSLHNLKALRGLGLADELDELVQRLEQHLPSDGTITNPILQLEAVPDYTGTEHLKPLYKAIREQTPQIVYYQSYRATQASPIEVHPYLLKTYNGRWYLIARNEAKGSHLQNYALDRIKKLEDSKLIFRPTDVDFSTYFDSIIGVTIPEKQSPIETVRLHIAAGRAPYVLTKALHSSQVTISNTADGLEIELQLIINQEFKTQLLSFGPDLQVLSPKSLRDSVHEKLKKAAARYK